MPFPSLVADGLLNRIHELADMAWHTDLLDDQLEAASHEGSPARLLAGPGTGKTLVLTRRIVWLIKERGVDPQEISALTFTRSAAFELRKRVSQEIKTSPGPRISTLHSFALRQLLRNSKLAPDLPKPLRIADDWEERNIIEEDLKFLLKVKDVREIRDKVQQLSADWQTLDAERADWSKRFPDPKFIGAWQEHRSAYGYLLRSELVYQLKRSFEQHEDFQLEGPPKYLLVDEYQDLNRCDLAVIRLAVERGAEIYAAGDDDQSIYGFRKAHPEGIRRFPKDCSGARRLSLKVCKRCDSSILSLGLFVAEQDPRRLPKVIQPEKSRGPGTVKILRFSGQNSEATAVAKICRALHERCAYDLDDILILLRTDRNRVFSSQFRAALAAQNVPVTTARTDSGPFDSPLGRQLLAFLRLALNPSDHLAWRTLLELRPNKLGEKAIQTLHELGRNRGLTFSEALRLVSETPTVVRRFGKFIAKEVALVEKVLKRIPVEEEGKHETEEASEAADPENLLQGIHKLARAVIPDPGHRKEVVVEIGDLVEKTGIGTIAELLRSVETSSEDLEQEVEHGKVSILTMHKAKGLTAKAVFAVACEDEYVPGRAEGSDINDERRLLYVSLTRAAHHLFITYCEERTGVQRHTGRTAGQSARHLTRFLRHGPIAPISGMTYANDVFLKSKW
jgi:DNA helicase-2/ATP-dependent DNA helicase PcrA